MSKNALIAKVKRTISKSNTDQLEDWTMPMLYIRGAGLHFGRDPSESIPLTGFTAERNIGPFPLPTAAIKVPPIYFPDKVANWLGLDGVWLDNRDVEVYLKQRGLNVDGRSRETVVEVDDVPELYCPSSTESSSDGLETGGTMVHGRPGRVDTSSTYFLSNGVMHSGLPKQRISINISLDELVESKSCLFSPEYKNIA